MTWSSGHGPGTGSVARSSLPAVPPEVIRKHRIGAVLFSVLVGLALLGGGVVVTLVLLASGRPDALVVGFLLAALPVGPLVACYLWLDRYEPEPVRLLLAALAWGALVATSAALVVQSVDQAINASPRVWSAVVVAPLTEEAGKGAFVVLLLWLRRHVLDGLLDGLVYAGLVGVGFAFTENILYFAGAYTGDPSVGGGSGGLGAATSLFVLRGVFSPFAHPLFTSAIGIGVGLAVGSRSRVLRVVAPVLGYLVAVALHASWNGSAFLYGGQLFALTYLFAMVPGLLGLIGLAVWFRVREGRMLARSLTDLAHRGYVAPQDIPWLVGLPGRRSVLHEAALRGGPATERLMRDYQQQAIEFAALHNRVLRGTAPADHGERGALMAQRLAALRAHLMATEQRVPSPHATGGWR